MKRSTRRLLKRALALILAFAIVISFGLYNSMDRVLQAEALPDDSAIEVVDEYEDFEEEEPEEEVVEVQLAERDEEDEAEADEADEIVEAEAVEDEEEEEETTTIAAEDADEDFADEETEDDGASDASEQKDKIARWTLGAMNALPEKLGEYNSVNKSGNVVSPASNAVKLMKLPCSVPFVPPAWRSSSPRCPTRRIRSSASGERVFRVVSASE